MPGEGCGQTDETGLHSTHVLVPSQVLHVLTVLLIFTVLMYFHRCSMSS